MKFQQKTRKTATKAKMQKVKNNCKHKTKKKIKKKLIAIYKSKLNKM